MKIFKYHIYLLSVLFSIATMQSQAETISEKLIWTDVQTLNIYGGEIHTLSFSGADNSDQAGFLPTYSKKFRIPTPGLVYEFSIANEKVATLENHIPISDIEDIDLVDDAFKSWTETIIIRGQSYSVFKLLPLRKNPATGEIEKLISFQLNYTLTPGGSSSPETKSRIYAEASVLAEGDWYKVAVAESGVYKITWQQLSDMGMNINGAESSTIRLFGNGGGMLPQKNSDFRFDDLQENAILVVDGDDGTFDQGDYFLFYGQSPHNWTYNFSRKAFEQSKNRFTELNYYFVSSGNGQGKRIESELQNQHPAITTITTYNEYASHEMDERSLIKSGREWYGEEFIDDLSHEFYFPFPNRDTTENVYVIADFAGRANQINHFTMYVNNDSIFTDNISAIPTSSYKYAISSNKYKWFKPNIIPDLNLTIEYDKPDDNAKGWLNYIQINVISHLRFNNQQFTFRNVNSALPGQVSEFVVRNTPENFRVWNITNPLLPSDLDLTVAEDVCRFRLATDSILEFVGFDGSDFLEVLPIGQIPNQNLHQYHTAEFIIVTHPDFLSHATRLKALHEELDGMEVIVATTDEIYNEFASGAPDVSAIRDFVRMVYTRSGHDTSPALKYVLLFGDGSYDPKDRVDGNKCYIPTFQSKQSLWHTASYVTDDYFGLMDASEGNDASGNIDLGIGRFPVNSVEEADLMVDKVESYMRMDPKVQGNWRNSICFIADDEDSNLHLHQADTVLVPRVYRKNESININKIYFDAYKQEYSASGHTYPDATHDFNKQVNEGTLIVNYTGHGGELGLAYEKVLQINDIISWTNADALPLFITATCEFSRFDNPTLTSAGELVLLNKNGGGIGLLTTTRLAFASSNLLLNKRIYDTLFNAYPQRIPRLGDLIMFSKNPSTSNLRNFVLLGNPALPLALPRYNVVTDSINGVSAEIYNDTLNANSTLVVSGHIEQFNNAGVASHFNGTLYPVLYDKPQQITTLGNDPKSYPYTFDLQNNKLCEGKASVKDGRFKFTFVLPKDIAYQYGQGKLSYYATDSLIDAAGYYSQLTVGGIGNVLNQDTKGPEIQLYLNDTSFVNGTEVDPNPVFLAQLSDPSGINFTGIGIGHDISLVVNGDTWNSTNLNSVFQPSMDDYSSGTIKFPLQNFANGTHTLELKAWDMFNNSSISTLEFTVSDNLNVNILDVYNYPNPFSDHTYFTFKHNQFDSELSMEISIFDLYGQHITTIGPTKVFRNGYGIEPIYWNGTNAGGAKLQPGVYLYSLKVSNDKSNTTQRIQKMIITD